MPADEQLLLIHDFRAKFLWGIRTRYGIMAVGLIIALFAWVNHLPLGLIAWLLLFLAAYNLLAHALIGLKKKPQLWEIISLITFFQFCDLLAVTFLIYMTGWLESPYWFLYLVLIIISGFGVFSRYSRVVFLIALFSVVFYLGLLTAAYLGIIPIYGPSFTLTPQELLRSIINRAIYTVVSFFLFAGTIYYFSRMLTQNQDDLTRKNLELLSTLEELKETDRLKDEFVATASHELRTPLAVVRENVSLIQDGLVGPVSEKQNKLLGSATNNIDRLAHILDDLLNIAKIQSHSLELKRQEVDVSELAKKALDLLQEMAERKQLTIRSDLPPKVSLWIDPDQILRVFINLLDNAIKYSHKGGSIKVTVAQAGKEVLCSVQDSGIGIKTADLPLVFERFIRFERAEEMSKRGSGLGLSICKGIVEMHGGKIWVESREGEGSTFNFSLPKVEING